MSSPIECRQCKAPLMIPDELQGKRIQCPRCQAEVMVPMAAVPLTAIAAVPMASVAPPPAWSSSPVSPAGQKSKRMETAIFALILGTIGVHKFMTDRRSEGLVMLCVSLTFIGMIVMGPIALIEAVKYLMMDDAEFHQTYLVEKRGWF